VSAFEVSGGDYLGTSSPTDGLPYGLSAEVFTAGALRKTASEQPDAFIREHVTAALSREAGSAGIVPRGWFLEHDHSSLRVTIDTLDDYLAIAPLFENVVCPATISWHELVKQLSTQGK
jgi:spore coat polysaccharide biosynthesis protein SpsF